MDTILSYIRQITEASLSFDVVDVDLLLNVFKCMNIVLEQQDPSSVDMDLTSELTSVVAHCKGDAAKLDAVYQVIVSTFPSSKALEAIQLCNPRDVKRLIEPLRRIVTKSAMEDFHAGLSGALLRVRRAREALAAQTNDSSTPILGDTRSSNVFSSETRVEPSYFDVDSSVWQKVLAGAAVIEK